MTLPFSPFPKLINFFFLQVPLHEGCKGALGSAYVCVAYALALSWHGAAYFNSAYARSMLL